MKKMPKILIDITPTLYPYQGTAVVTKSLLKAIEQQSPSIEIITYSRSMKRKPTKELKFPHIHLSAPRIFENFIKYFGLIEKKSKANLFHATDHYLPLKNPKKAVVTVHDLMFINQFDQEWEAHKHLRKKAVNFLENSQAIITCSQSTKSDLKTLLNIPEDKIHVIPWGVDHELFFPNYKNNDQKKFKKPYFLAVGCSAKRRNTSNILEAYKELLRQSPTHELVLVSPPPETTKKKYESLLKSPHVHTLKNISDLQLAELYQNASALFYPSSYEGFGCPILEAQACGTLVVTSRNSSLEEVAGNGAFFLESTESKHIQQAMENIENKTFNSQEIINFGINNASNYHWDRTAKETLQVYLRYLEEN